MERFQEIDKLKERLDSYIPIPEEKLKASIDKFKAELTYHSNALEGSLMTHSETSLFIQEGLTSHGKELAEYIKIIAHMRALKKVNDIIEKGDTLSEELIKDIHTCLFSDNITMGDTAAPNRVVHESYRCENTHTILPEGNIHDFTHYSRIPEELSNLITWYSENKDALHPVELSARVHHRFLAIHPFTDGNGRVSRLIMNMILMQHGYPPAIIRVTDKAEYLEALYRADKGNCDMLISIVEEEVIKTMAQLLNIFKVKEEKVPHYHVEQEETPKKELSQPFSMTMDFETKRNECVRELYSILHSQIKCLIENHGLVHEQSNVTDHASTSPAAGKFSFMLTGPVKTQDVIGKGFIYNALNNRNTIPLFDMVEDILISSRHYLNYLSENGSSLLLEIVPELDYIPSSFLTFNIIPIRQAVYIVYVIMIGRTEDNAVVVYCSNTDLIQGSYNFNNWKKGEVEEFLIKGFNEFLSEIKKSLSVEECRRL